MDVLKVNKDTGQLAFRDFQQDRGSNTEQPATSDMSVLATLPSAPTGRTQNIAPASVLFDKPAGVDLDVATNAKFQVDELPDGACVSPHNVAVARTESETTTARTVEYIGSFSVAGADQNERAEYVQKQLAQMRNIQKLKPVLLAVSLSGIKVCHSSGKSVFMAHALKRISYATCDPEFRQFSFLAREPKGHTTLQYCHAFFTKTSQEAEELNAIVSNAFRMAFALEQEGASAIAPTTPPTFNSVIEQQVEAQRAEAVRRVTEKEGELQQQLERISTARAAERAVERRKLRQSQLLEMEHAREIERLQGKERSTWAKQVVNRARHRAPFQADRVSRQVSAPSPGANNSPESCVLSQLLDESGRGYGSPVMTLKLHIDNHYQSGSRVSIQQLERYLQKTGGGGGVAGGGSPGGSPAAGDSGLATGDSSPATSGSPASAARGDNMDGIIDTPSPQSRKPTHHHCASTDSSSSSSSHDDVIAVRTNGVTPRNKKIRPLSGRYQNSTPPHLTGEIDITDSLTAPEDGNDSMKHTDHREASLSEQLRHAPWFQAGIPREMALEILSQQAIGSFIVRTSTTHQGCYALSVKVPKYDNPSGISHYLLVSLANGHFKVNGLDKEWPTLTALVTHHTVMPEMLPCTLRLPRVCRNPSFRDTERDDEPKRETRDGELSNVGCDQLLSNLKL